MLSNGQTSIVKKRDYREDASNCWITMMDFLFLNKAKSETIPPTNSQESSIHSYLLFPIIQNHWLQLLPYSVNVSNMFYPHLWTFDRFNDTLPCSHMLIILSARVKVLHKRYNLFKSTGEISVQQEVEIHTQQKKLFWNSPSTWEKAELVLPSV